jgi:hypothetical protein
MVNYDRQEPKSGRRAEDHLSHIGSNSSTYTTLLHIRPRSTGPADPFRWMGDCNINHRQQPGTGEQRTEERSIASVSSYGRHYKTKTRCVTYLTLPLGRYWETAVCAASHWDASRTHLGSSCPTEPSALCLLSFFYPFSNNSFPIISPHVQRDCRLLGDSIVAILAATGTKSVPARMLPSVSLFGDSLPRMALVRFWLLGIYT